MLGETGTRSARLGTARGVGDAQGQLDRRDLPQRRRVFRIGIDAIRPPEAGCPRRPSEEPHALAGPLVRSRRPCRPYRRHAAWQAWLAASPGCP